MASVVERLYPVCVEAVGEHAAENRAQERDSELPGSHYVCTNLES